MGFVQIYKYDDKKSETLIKYDSIYEYDIFFGESEYLSKGLGAKIVNYIQTFIFMIIFGFIVSIGVHFALKNINLIESLKSVE